MKHGDIELGPGSPLLPTPGKVRAAPVQHEKVEVAAGDDMLGKMGFTSIHFSQARATQQTPGIPDRKYYRGEVTFWWEAKAPGGVQSKAQREFQERAERAHELYVLGTFDDLKQWLIAMGYLLP